MSVTKLRQEYHQQICTQIIRLHKDGQAHYHNFADKGNKASRAIAQGITKRLGCSPGHKSISGQTAGELFEEITRSFLEQAFALLQHLRPGEWYYSTQTPISEFDQYAHLANLEP